MHRLFPAALMTLVLVLVACQAAPADSENATPASQVRFVFANDAPRLISADVGEEEPLRLDPAGGEVDWTLKTGGGEVKLSDCTVTATENGWHVATPDDVSFDVVREAIADGVKLGVTNVQGPLRGIDFSGDPLIVAHKDNGPWTLATADMMSGGVLREAFEPSAKRSPDWAILYNGKVALAMQNTIPFEPLRVGSTAEACTIGSGEWHYDLAGDNLAPLYTAAVGVVGDINGDGTADWQDGCIFLQRHVPGRGLPDLINHSLLGWVGVESSGESNGMNATFPQVLDIIRKQYNLTAGEPTTMGLAGWCYWGWDSEYPAAEEASRRAGGNRGLVDLCQEAWRYGSTVGLCINHEDAYRHSPAWNEAIMCTHEDGRVKRYQLWNGGMAWYICPYKDVATGENFKRIDTMFDFGMAGSAYIDVLSADGAMMKTSEGPAGKVRVIDNIVAGRWKTADYYWGNGLKLYSEHTTYPYVGKILGGLNNRETGLDFGDATKIPMPAFILHGRMNNFFSATRYGHGGRLLLGIVDNVAGHIGSPNDEHLDKIYLSMIPARSFVTEKMRSFTFDKDTKTFRTTFTGGVEVTLGNNGQYVEAKRDGRKFADAHSCFVPRAKGGYWAYSDQAGKIAYPLPKGWDAAKIRVFALNRFGRHEEVFNVANANNNDLTLKMFERVPYLVTNGEDLVPVASEDYGRMKRTLLAQAPIPADDDVVLPDAPSGVYTDMLILDDARWMAWRKHDSSDAYRDKLTRPKDALVLLDADNKPAKEIPVLGPVTGLLYDEARNQLMVASGAFNFDCVQFVDLNTQEVVGMVPLVPDAWGENLQLAIVGDILYVAAPNTQNVAAIKLGIPWPKEAQAWCQRIFEKGTDPRDPEAALDEFLRVRWDRLRTFHAIGAPITHIFGGDELTVLCNDAPSLVIEPADGPWKPESKNGDFPPPFEALARAARLPREKIVATNLPGNAQPWWLTLPDEKHHIIPEPQPQHGYRIFSMGPRYADRDKAIEHAALICALRSHNYMQDKTTMPLFNLGKAMGAPRKMLRDHWDYWVLGKIYGRMHITAETILDLDDTEIYVETLDVPEKGTMYRAGVGCIVPYETMDEIYMILCREQEAYYRAKAENTDKAPDKTAYNKLADVFQAAPEKAGVTFEP
jgi:hypothetical protein